MSNTTDNPENEPVFLAPIRQRIAGDTHAQDCGYGQRLEAKIERLLQYLPHPAGELEPFFATILYNLAIRPTDIDNTLLFITKKTDDEREQIAALIALCSPSVDEATISSGLSENSEARQRARQALLRDLESIRKFTAKAPSSAWQPDPLRKMARALTLEPAKVLDIVRIRPRILRGLSKPPRPRYAVVGPLLLAILVGVMLLSIWPQIPFLVLYSVFMLIIIVGVWVVSMHLAIAPGVLLYPRTGHCLRQALTGAHKWSAIGRRMAALGIDCEEFAQERRYENPELGTRIIIRDKRTIDGAVQFLTSSEEIGNCIALRNFVAWTLPAYLADNGIMLADVFSRSSRGSFSQRGQVWMVAAERCGTPVLVINSIEFNDQGAKHTDLLMPEIVAMVKDVAHRAHYEEIYVGVSEYGRNWLDSRFAQGATRDPVQKVHDPESGFSYHFDVFRTKWHVSDLRVHRSWVYAVRRSLMARAYSVIFGMIEHQKGHSASARAFFDTAANPNNFWMIPLAESTEPDPTSE